MCQLVQSVRGVCSMALRRAHRGTIGSQAAGDANGSIYNRVVDRGGSRGSTDGSMGTAGYCPKNPQPFTPLETSIYGLVLGKVWRENEAQLKGPYTFCTLRLSNEVGRSDVEVVLTFPA